MIVGLLSTFSVFGQEVISTSGRTHSAGSLIISQTVGETVTTTISNGVTVTQGFHQNELMATAINEQNEAIEVNVYPNPFVQQLTITSQKELSSLQVFDISGAVVHNAIVYSGQTIFELDLSRLSTGQYLLRVQAKDNKKSSTYSLIKL